MTIRLLAVGTLALALSGPGLAKSDAAHLRLAHASPISARGTGFKPLEYVRVTLSVSHRRLVRGARASSAGSFTVVWRGVTLQSCDWRLSAVGGGGSRAAVRGDAAACQTSPFDG
jgi:hypothetical protein